jgi:hypothetical protein
MQHWASGYTQLQVDDAQERYGLRFPPDLVELFLERRPAGGYAWHTEDARIRDKLEWPFEMLLFDVEQGFWWPDWGERPSKPAEQAEVLRDAIARTPRLIPLLSHRFLPETPSEAGNPVFSMHGFDTIYYGSNLAEYFHNEFEASPGRKELGPVRHIPFWSDIAERPDIAYACYEANRTEEEP